MAGLIEFYRLVEYRRHITVHEFRRHDLNQLKRLNRWFKIDSLSRTSFLTNDRTILIKADEADDLIEAVSGIAYHVYRGISDAYDMPDDFFDEE